MTSARRLRQAYLLETLAPESQREAHVCYSIWHQSTNFDDLFLYEACIRSILGSQRNFGKVRIVRKQLEVRFLHDRSEVRIRPSAHQAFHPSGVDQLGTGWVRDIWITNSMWSLERDFMLHGMKESDRSTIPDGLFSWLRSRISSRFTWYPPLTKDLDLKQCPTGNVEWHYDTRLRVPRATIEEQLREIARVVEKERWSALGRVKDYL
ncbi:hypothetical protein RB195_006596 [Necator americanus]|uniref:Uncharacterized protein n=1 Tax=Necator americanus TaxID=51031 RepID=A0ABR1BV61_NECAM